MSTDGGVVSQLNISHTRVDDGGLFSCVATHSESVLSHHDRVNVYGEYIIFFIASNKIRIENTFVEVVGKGVVSNL